jgi:hypothetical protein
MASPYTMSSFKPLSLDSSVKTSSLRSVDETRLKFKTSTETAQNNEMRVGSKEVVEYVMKDELSRVKKMNKEERNSDSELED